MEPRRILALNLLYLRELGRLLEAADGVAVMALKGGALLMAGYRDPSVRVMEDLDLLLRPEQFGRLARALESLGYRKARGDPGQFRKEGLAFDLQDRIWYLERPEEEAMWSRSRVLEASGRPVRVQAPRDLLIHVAAHAATHHGEADPKWEEDVRAVLRAHASELDLAEVRGELRRLGLWPVASRYLNGADRHAPGWLDALGGPYRGHLLRTWFLRGWRFRFRHALGSLFPSADFIRRRYDLESARRVLPWRLARPFVLGAKLCAAVLRAVVAFGPRRG